MLAAVKPKDELTRLETLHDLLILDTPPEERFEVLTTYATFQFNVSTALVSLVDADRQWFKAKKGLTLSETPRDSSFCAHAILADDVLIVRDALKDERFFDNPLVVGEPKIRFYAGAPLIMPNGQRVGTFCLIDQMPHRLEPHEIDHLRDLAKVVVQELQGIAASAAFMKQVA